MKNHTQHVLLTKIYEGPEGLIKDTKRKQLPDQDCKDRWDIFYPVSRSAIRKYFQSKRDRLNNKIKRNDETIFWQVIATLILIIIYLSPEVFFVLKTVETLSDGWIAGLVIYSLLILAYVIVKIVRHVDYYDDLEDGRWLAKLLSNSKAIRKKIEILNQQERDMLDSIHDEDVTKLIQETKIKISSYGYMLENDLKGPCIGWNEMRFGRISLMNSNMQEHERLCVMGRNGEVLPGVIFVEYVFRNNNHEITSSQLAFDVLLGRFSNELHKHGILIKKIDTLIGESNE